MKIYLNVTSYVSMETEVLLLRKINFIEISELVFTSIVRIKVILCFKGQFRESDKKVVFTNRARFFK